MVREETSANGSVQAQFEFRILLDEKDVQIDQEVLDNLELYKFRIDISLPLLITTKFISL